MKKKLPYNDGESDVLIIGYDQGDKDKPCIVVCRKRRGGLNYVNSIYGEEAVELYQKLLTPSAKSRYNRVIQRSINMYGPETKNEQVNKLRSISYSICYDIVQKIAHERIVGHINTEDEYNWLVIDICKNLIEGAELEHFKKIVGM